MIEYVLAIDPGKVTGWAWMRFSEIEPMERVMFGLIHDGKRGFDQWLMTNPVVGLSEHIICESYVPDGRAGDPELIPSKIEGALDLFTKINELPPVTWQTNGFKRHVSDDVLRAHDLWVTNEQARGLLEHIDGRDVNDAIVHALAWAKLRNHQPTVAMYWPDE